MLGTEHTEGAVCHAGCKQVFSVNRSSGFPLSLFVFLGHPICRPPPDDGEHPSPHLANASQAVLPLRGSLRAAPRRDRSIIIPHRFHRDLTGPPGQFFFSGDRSPAGPDRGDRKNVAPLCTEGNWDAAYSVLMVAGENSLYLEVGGTLEKLLQRFSEFFALT